MATTVAYDEVSESRICREVKGGLRWSTYFMQPPKGTRLPQAFLVENTPHRLLRTHYHDVDQFQVIVSGDGTLGKHAVRPYSVHFARAHTPYGPITAGDKGLAWLTIRARRDAEGAQFLPEKREQLVHLGCDQVIMVIGEVLQVERRHRRGCWLRRCGAKASEKGDEQEGIIAQAVDGEPGTEGLDRVQGPAFANEQAVETAQECF